jgi:hypothetical protein
LADENERFKLVRADAIRIFEVFEQLTHFQQKMGKWRMVMENSSLRYNGA